MSVKTKLKAGCGVLTLLGMGYVLGAISLLILIIISVTTAESWKSDDSKEHAVNQLVKQLQLTEEQIEQVRPIVHDFLDHRWELRSEYLKETEQMMETDYLPKIEKLLTDEQKEKLKGLKKKWHDEHLDRMEREAKKTAAPTDP